MSRNNDKKLIGRRAGNLLFIKTEKTRVRERKWDGVGYEGQRDETWGSQGPSHTGLSKYATLLSDKRRGLFISTRTPPESADIHPDTPTTPRHPPGHPRNVGSGTGHGQIVRPVYWRLCKKIWTKILKQRTGLLIDKSIKRKLNRRLIYECRCDERLEAKSEVSTRLTYTGWFGGLEHLKIETRLIDERFVSVMGECVIWTTQVDRRYSK